MGDSILGDKLTQEPSPITPNPSSDSGDGASSGFADSSPQFGTFPPGSSNRATTDPGHSAPPPHADFGYAGEGSRTDILNGATNVEVKNLRTTVAGRDNIREQTRAAASAQFYNIFPSGLDRPKAQTLGPDVVDAIIRARAYDLDEKEGYLKKREADLREQENRMEKREKALEEERKSMEAERRSVEEERRSMEEMRIAMEQQRNSMAAKERTLDQVTKSLKNAERELIEIRTADLQRKPGEPLPPAGRLGSLGWRYATDRLMQVFGERAVGINDLAHQVNFSLIDINDRGEKPFFSVPLAPQYGDLARLDIFSESMKVAIWSVLNAVETRGRTVSPFDWNSLEELLTTNKCLESSGPARSVKDGPIWLKENLKGVDLSVLNEWLQVLLSTCNISQANQSLTKVAGKRPKGSGQEASAAAYDTKPLVEILVLWFPANERRSFQISRTTLKLCTTPRQTHIFNLGQEKKRHFILTEHQTSCPYHPRESFVYDLASEAREAMVREVASLIRE